MRNRTGFWKKSCAWMLTFSTALGCLLIPRTEVKAEEYWPEGPGIVSPNAVVFEINTGAVLYEKNSHEVHYPASITKILTTLLAVENCELSETVTFSDDAINKNEGATSHIARDYGEEMTLEQTLYATMLFSANECAYATAEHVGKKLGGDYQTFIDLMNSRAKELGCNDTHFNNPNGLPDPDHWTSAYDMGLIACEAYRNESFRIIAGTKTYTIPPTNKHVDETPLYNQHCMLYPAGTRKYLYEGCTGGKTGFTDAAGNTLVTFAERDGMALCCVILNSSRPNHYVDTVTLMDYCFDNFHTYNISENEESVIVSGETDKGLLNNNDPFVTLDRNAYIVLPKTVEFNEASFELIQENKDDEVAKLQYTYADHEVGSVEIVASGAKAEENSFGNHGVVEKDPDLKVVKIHPWKILLGIIIAAAVVALIYYGKRFYDNFFVILHKRDVKKQQKDRFKRVKKKKRHRKKDILFK